MILNVSKFLITIKQSMRTGRFTLLALLQLGCLVAITPAMAQKLNTLSGAGEKGGV
jgi:hypothetical protein